MTKTSLMTFLLVISLLFSTAATDANAAFIAPDGKPHQLEIGDNDFLLDGRPLQIRCGEIHFARVPREYWRHRLKLCKAMGLNAVCAYLFWNYHEWEQGQYDWSGQRDVAEFCRMAQEEGLWMILRPGPYACAEWEMGGLPWWLLKHDDIRMRSRDERFIEAARGWLKEVGRVLGPMQVSEGGPILLVQVENEYGFYGSDAAYMGEVRQALLDAGFDVPLFACNPVWNLRNGLRKDLFNVVNFGNNPEAGFKALREVQPTGPLMCGEFYPGWFDTWGMPHHLGNTERYLQDLEYMLSHNTSFSIYMAHGGTTFGMWAGCDRPFKPDTSSYDYDAPISEAGWIGEKFHKTRALMEKYKMEGEVFPEPPAANPVMEIAPFELTETAAVFDNLPKAIRDQAPRNMEAYDLGRGLMVYRTILPAGPTGQLTAEKIGDFGWVFVDGQPAGVMDRRSGRIAVTIDNREQPAQLDILVHAMGRVNFGTEVHDRKGLTGPVEFVALGDQPRELKNWQVFLMELGDKSPSGLKWQKAAASGPAFWRGRFKADSQTDTFLDMKPWGKGVVWINGRCLGRYWNIGPTQTMYVPGPWLRAGDNEVVVLDLVGPQKPVLAGVKVPVLGELRPELDFSRKGSKGKLMLDGVKPVHTGSFKAGSEAQVVHFTSPAEGRQFCLESLNAHDGQAFAAAAEMELLDEQGESIPHTTWTIAFVSSEELIKEDGSALNAINGQTADHWHTEWGVDPAPAHPHRLIIDLGKKTKIAGLRFTPRSGSGSVGGRIKDFRAYIGDQLVIPE